MTPAQFQSIPVNRFFWATLSTPIVPRPENGPLSETHLLLCHKTSATDFAVAFHPDVTLTPSDVDLCELIDHPSNHQRTPLL